MQKKYCWHVHGISQQTSSGSNKIQDDGCGENHSCDGLVVAIWVGCGENDSFDGPVVATNTIMVAIGSNIIINARRDSADADRSVIVLKKFLVGRRPTKKRDVRAKYQN